MKTHGRPIATVTPGSVLRRGIPGTVLGRYGGASTFLVGPVATLATGADITTSDASAVAFARELDGVVYTADDRLLDSLGEDFEDVARHVRAYPS